MIGSPKETLKKNVPGYYGAWIKGNSLTSQVIKRQYIYYD